jgi:hypothetical protein
VARPTLHPHQDDILAVKRSGALGASGAGFGFQKAWQGDASQSQGTHPEHVAAGSTVAGSPGTHRQIEHGTISSVWRDHLGGRIHLKLNIFFGTTQAIQECLIKQPIAFKHRKRRMSQLFPFSWFTNEPEDHCIIMAQ